jgi:hypothetical protein
MKTKITKLGLLLFAIVGLSSCITEVDLPDTVAQVPPTRAEFKALENAALENITQNFQFIAENGTATFMSTKGVTISIYPGCMTLNGNPVSGTVDLEYIEIFDKGTMAVTNKSTMGRMGDGNLSLLISGGEFYINATQNGQQLQINCGINLTIPTNLTNGFDPAMTLWEGTVENDSLIWDEMDNESGQENGVGGGENPTGGEGVFYYAYFGNFGWTNVDRFYSDPRPKTTLLVDVPEGYDNQNSAVYISYDGEGNALAKLDTYTNEGYFSEHYGMLPIGLACHVIFVTEEDGQFRYAIKAVTIQAGQIITFAFSETVTGSEQNLVDAINTVQ